MAHACTSTAQKLLPSAGRGLRNGFPTPPHVRHVSLQHRNGQAQGCQAQEEQENSRPRAEELRPLEHTCPSRDTDDLTFRPIERRRYSESETTDELVHGHSLYNTKILQYYNTT